MSSDLKGKRVLITGASAGIGRATAKAFVDAGAHVYALARSKESLDSLASELGGPPRVVPIVADVADAAAMNAATGAILDRDGAPDVVIANAGIGLDAPFVATSDELLKQVLDVNVFGVVRTLRPFLPAMIARGSGRMLIVSSVVGRRGVPSYSAYSASKFALHGMADAIRPEIRGTGVSLGIVCPSSTTSEFESRRLREGPAQIKVRVQKHSAESVAKALVRMARSRRREMVLSPEGKLMLVLNWLSPGGLDWILSKTLVRRSATRPSPGP